MSSKFIVPLALAGAGFIVYKVLFKEPGHPANWGPTQAREYFQKHGEHHPDTLKKVRRQVDNPKELNDSIFHYATFK
ncbi:MAG: hypothetical protein H9W81_13800 [Enterococcus sp.]|nr:hypothetical protein [Enterococcus sp.]